MRRIAGAALSLLGALSVVTSAPAGAFATQPTAPATAVAAQPAARAAATPACFGAAARDPLAPCTNAALNRVAIPTPYDAPLEPSEACERIARTSPPACAFGTPAAKAKASVALLGDSHATHWRAALAYLARKRQWHGISINRNLCPFTLARTKRNDRCKGWTRGALRWLRNHPEVHSVFVSANAGSGVQVVGGRTQGETKLSGYLRAWSEIPASVREVFVLRDVPHSAAGTAECVAAALARHRNPARRCPRPRAAALVRDIEAEAAALDPGDRVQVVDLTPFMCDDENCLPVVGGALVIKDIGHMTRTFSRTLGPFLGRAVDALRRRARGARAGATVAAASVAPAAAATRAPAAPTAARAAATPACFGAAARDPERPCVNRALTAVAIPSPYAAPLEPSAPCAPIWSASPPACWFGRPRGKAVSSVALLGDSHATAWRAAVAVVADA
ncbi:MAG: hypothetical protein QOE31_477, partial [Solirubrobacteraceae bacterium]|nr:hypothetical protein [Solirubrobacteraceae bacterium]